VVAIIELDDRTHSPERDKERDALLETAGYRVLRFQSKQKPSIDEISALFFVQKSLDSEQQF
jgi:very-short-patch-repair endonuclease